MVDHLILNIQQTTLKGNFSGSANPPEHTMYGDLYILALIGMSHGLKSNLSLDE